MDGVDDLFADERSDEAQAGGVWTNQSIWIANTLITRIINLLDTTGGTLHGPSDYQIVDSLANPIPPVIASGSPGSMSNACS